MTNFSLTDEAIIEQLAAHQWGGFVRAMGLLGRPSSAWSALTEAQREQIRQGVRALYDTFVAVHRDAAAHDPPY